MVIGCDMFWILKEISILYSIIKSFTNVIIGNFFYYRIKINNIWMFYVYIFSKIHLRSILFFFYKTVWLNILEHFVLKKIRKKSTWYEVTVNLKLLLDLIIMPQFTNSTNFCRLICTCTQAITNLLHEYKCSNSLLKFLIALIGHK